MMVTMLGMAIGTGNIWRFPRIVAANGGGAFLIAWICFLLLWSVPLLLVEFSMGKAARRGPIGAFAAMLGRGYAWMGAWVAFTATAIMFYYSVVAGWTIRYFWAAAAGELHGEAAGALWARFAGTGGAVFTHAIAMSIGVLVVLRGVRGIERVAGILIPTLCILVLVLALRAVTLPGASEGLAFLFTPQWQEFGRASLWLEALTQNAWDTGAGWGLALTYAVYMRSREDTALNSFILGFGNNSISLLAGIMVICTIFAVGPAISTRISETPESFERALQSYPGLQERLESGLREVGAGKIRPGIMPMGEEVDGFFSADGFPIEQKLAVAREAGLLEGQALAEAVLGSGSNGLTFTWVPQIFDTLPAGRLLTTLFFLALAFAAIISLIAMIELATRVLVDAGVPRRRAVPFVGGAGFLLGVPSAISMNVFENQDFVWSVGLVLSGFFFAFAVTRFGARTFRARFINTDDSDLPIGRWWDFAIFLVLAEAVVLMGWWLYQAIDFEDFRASFTPFSSFNAGTLLVQWGMVLIFFLFFNRQLAQAGLSQPAPENAELAGAPLAGGR